MPGTCSIHPDRPIAGVCTLCGRTACAECLVDLAGQTCCKTCLAARVRAPLRRISGFWRFVLSVIPGVGHLYMGLLNRGFQIMAAAVAGGLIFGVLFGPFTLLWIGGVVCYSIFDAREAHLRILQGGEVPDKLLFDLNFHFNQKWIAYGLIVVGLIALYNTLMNDILSTFMRYGPYYYALVHASRSILFGAACLGVGAWMLRRPTPPPTPPDRLPVDRPAGRPEENDQ